MISILLSQSLSTNTLALCCGIWFQLSENQPCSFFSPFLCSHQNRVVSKSFHRQNDIFFPYIFFFSEMLMQWYKVRRKQEFRVWRFCFGWSFSVNYLNKLTYVSTCDFHFAFPKLTTGAVIPTGEIHHLFCIKAGWHGKKPMFWYH